MRRATCVLRHFGVSSATHDVCFTANTTAAIKLVAEGFAFSPARSLLLSQDNHNSVNGLREFASRAGSAVRYVALDDELRLVDPVDALREHGGQAGLFAFPAQSNFSGVLHPLALVAEARAHGWRVLLDAASFVPTHPLDLSGVRSRLRAGVVLQDVRVSRWHRRAHRAA